MPYMLLIMEQGEDRRGRPMDDGRLLYERMVRFSESLRARGLLKASEALRSDADGARVTVSGGKRTVVDGPFSESKEIVGGFFLLDCESREEAIAIAAECPAAEWATVEVRSLGPCFE